MVSRLRLPLAAAVFAAIAMLVLVLTPSLGNGAAGVTYTFDGAPASPKPFNPADWDVAVSSRDVSTYYTPESMHAVHGGDCGAPPATHEITTYAETVFQCKDHVMTSILAGGYGVIYLTPNQLVDFSQGEAVIRWDSSTFRTTARDFLDFWVTPYDLNEQLPMDDWLPDTQGEPKEAIHIRMDGNLGNTHFKASIVKNHQVIEIPGNWWTGYETVLTPDMKIRSTFELRISKNHIKFGMPEYDLWWVDADIADLGWSQGIFQLGHHSYNPWKDGGPGPNTWHFDNVSISPAVAFTMLKGNVRYVDAPNQVVQFNGAAPANSHLRFSAVGLIDVSYDGGRTWSRAERQVQEFQKPDHFSSYWTPIPAGTTSVMFRGSKDDWFDTWFAKDFGIWSKSAAGSAPAPTNTPIPPANTPVPPTATGVPPTNTAVPSSTTAAPSGTTVVATATSTTATGGSNPTSTPTKTTVPATATATKTAVPPTAKPVVSNPSQSQPGSRVQFQGKDWYLHGVNLPWYNWGCDFGCNSNGGASSTAVKNAVGPRLATLKQSGIHNLRWWLFPGDPWQITRDSSGAPTGINPAVYADIDAALAMAETNDLYLTFTVFSAPSALPSSWLTNATHREKLALALGDLFAHYAGNPRILAWEVMNEPEWDIWTGKVVQSDVTAMVQGVVNQVHQRGGGTLVTVGGAMVDGLPMWVGMGLDFHSPHWYDYMSSGDWCARCTDYATLKQKYQLDAPVVIGEFYAGTDADAANRYTDFYNKGYAGAWAWSLFPEKTADLLGMDMNAAAAFAAAKSDDGPASSSSSTQPTATPTRTATKVPATPTKTATPVSSTATPVKTSTPGGSQPAATVTATATKTSLVTKWTSSVTVNPTGGARPGGLATFNINVTANGKADALVAMEVYDQSGNRILQRSWDNRSFTTNLRRRFAATWVVPADLAPGTYTIKVGVFSPGWGTVYSWNDNAGTLKIK